MEAGQGGSISHGAGEDTSCPRGVTVVACSRVGTLVWGVVFGAIGSGYFLYGRKQTALVPLLCGLALMGFPYFVDDQVMLVAIGLVLCAVPFVIRD